MPNRFDFVFLIAKLSNCDGFLFEKKPPKEHKKVKHYALSVNTHYINDEMCIFTFKFDFW